MHRGETLNLLFQSRQDGKFELQVKEAWTGHVVTSNFVPPYQGARLNDLLKKLNKQEIDERRLRDIGERLFQALCGSHPGGRPRGSTPGARVESSEYPVQAVLRSVISRTLRGRATASLTLNFGPGCEEFVRYPWELLHDGEYFLLASGIFTLTRVLFQPDEPINSALPLYPPIRILHIGASPADLPSLEIESSYEALADGLSRLIESEEVHLERLNPPTYQNLVRYLDLFDGTNPFDDESSIPCTVLHFDGHGIYGRLCPAEECETVTADAPVCSDCGASLRGVKAQTYLCFPDGEGKTQFIGTDDLLPLLRGSAIRLAVFSACESAALTDEPGGHKHGRAAVDATLATALVQSGLAAVVAMPFSLQDELTPTFTFHFYEALADGRALQEALARARQAMLPLAKHHSWFIPVLYRSMSEEEQGPVSLLGGRDAPEGDNHSLGHLAAPTAFVGREQELHDLSLLLASASGGDEFSDHSLLPPGVHHIALTGQVGIGKSALGLEAVKRNAGRFGGGILALSLQDGKSFGEALIDIAHALHLPSKSVGNTDLPIRMRDVLRAFRTQANREMPFLLLLDGFEEVKEHREVSDWLRFLCALPAHVVVLITSRSNPANMDVLEGSVCYWYEYPLSKMSNTDLLDLFKKLAASGGFDQRMHIEDPEQQAILQDISILLDGYPLGAELIFGTAHRIGERVFAPEAATRSLREVRDELKKNPLEGIAAVLAVAYERLTPPARLLLSYLAALTLPFSHEHILMLVAPERLASAALSLQPESSSSGQQQGAPSEAAARELEQHWSAARNELVGSSFLQFDGRVYSIHPQVRKFAFRYLSEEQRRHAHRVAAAYYSNLPQPSPDVWFAAFDHLEDAGEPQDLRAAIDLAIRASWAMCGHGHALELLDRLNRAERHASILGDKIAEGRIQCCIGAIQRVLGRYGEAISSLTRSLAILREQRNADNAGWALYELSSLFREEGQLQQASQYAQQALDLFREAGDANGEAWMHLVLGEVSRGYGRYYDALGRFELALSSFRDQHNDEGLASALRARGTIQEALARYSEALSDYAEALRLFRTLGLRIGEAWVLADQSVVYVDQGQLEQAKATCTEAIAIFREQHIRRGEAWALRAMAEAAWERHHYEDARTYTEGAFTIFTSLGDRLDGARVLNVLGAIAFKENDTYEAKERYEQAYAIAQELEAQQIEGRALRGLGDVASKLREWKEAEVFYTRAFEIAISLDTPTEQRATLHHRGNLRLLQSEFRSALEDWVHALSLDHRPQDHPARKELQESIDVLVEQHQLQEAYDEFRKQYGMPSGE